MLDHHANTKDSMATYLIPNTDKGLASVSGPSNHDLVAPMAGKLSAKIWSKSWIGLKNLCFEKMFFGEIATDFEINQAIGGVLNGK